MNPSTVFGFSTFTLALDYIKSTGKKLMVVRRVGMFLVGNNWEIKIAKSIIFVS